MLKGAKWIAQEWNHCKIIYNVDILNNWNHIRSENEKEKVCRILRLQELMGFKLTQKQ